MLRLTGRRAFTGSRRTGSASPDNSPTGYVIFSEGTSSSKARSTRAATARAAAPARATRCHSADRRASRRSTTWARECSATASPASRSRPTLPSDRCAQALPRALDSRGRCPLYVASRTATGFEVRQMGGGRTSIPFAYRIVAKPYGAGPERLAFKIVGGVSTIDPTHGRR